MNPKSLLLTLLTIPLAASLTSCGESAASPAPAPENGAQFKEDKGVALTPLMAQSIGLQTAEVVEEAIAPAFTVPMQAVQTGREISGWLTADQAARVRPGMGVELSAGKGSVLRVEKMPYATLGDFEVTVLAEGAADAGVSVDATFPFPAGDPVTAIPVSALLTTAEGTFVYAKNDEFFLRTPVKTGARSGSHVEIADGLYTGDEIVTSPVMALWLAELQSLRGGKACTCGH